MSIFDRVDNVRRLWTLMLPDVGLPSDTWLARWCASFPDEIIETALAQTSKKFANAGVADESVHRYATSTMRHAAERRKQEVEAA
jgi:hypothetical protein